MDSRAAESFEERHRREAGANPPDLHFLLRTTQGQKLFHPGETIPITLEFSSDTPEKYKLDAGTYDRGGRLWSEEFVLNRDDVVDPLADYFGSGVMGGVGGGIRGTPALAERPVAIHLRLNDWFRFDRPGQYRLFLKSHRLSRKRTAGESGEGLVNFAAISNILDVQICEPDPQWEAEKLAQLRAALEPSSQDASEPSSSRADSWPREELLRAQQELGYLGTADAVRLLFTAARDNINNLKVFGLIRSPHRGFVISELNRQMERPGVQCRTLQAHQLRRGQGQSRTISTRVDLRVV